MPVYLGIDGSQDSHELCWLNAQAAIIARATIPHALAGFAQLDTIRQKLGVEPADCWVGLETAHTLLIDWLWAHGYHQGSVIPPSQVRDARKRHRQSGAYSDPFDAHVLADLLRTDAHRLPPWFPDSPLVRQLRAKVSLWIHLTQSMTRITNRLGAVLERYYPAALHVFSRPIPPLGLQFLLRYPTPAEAAQLSWSRFVAFARSHHARQPEQTLRRSFARLQQVYPEADSAVIAAYGDEAVLLAEQLLQLHQQKQVVGRSLQQLFVQHPDAALFTSLPGVGPFLGPALLAKFGDDRRRFPCAASLQALAGSCPVTEQSGKRKKVIKFRLGCDREFRWIVQQWALAAVGKSVWAAGSLAQVRERSRSRSHAYRCVANRLLAIAWKVWQARRPYDEAYHLARQREGARPRAA